MVIKLSWRIENFCMLNKKTCEYIDSPDFKISSLENKYAYLRLYPEGISYKTHISYYLYLHETLENGIVIKFTFTYNNHSVSQKVTFTTDNKNDLRHSFERTKIRGIGSIENLFLLQDVVEIECVIENEKNGGSSSAICCNANTTIKIENFTFDLPFNSNSTAWEKKEVYSRNFSMSPQSDKFGISIKLEDFLKSEKDHTVEIRRMAQSSTATSIGCQISLLNNILACEKYLFEYDSENDHWIIPFSFKTIAISKIAFVRCKILMSDGTILPNLEPEKGIPMPICIASEKVGQKLLNGMFEKRILCDVTLLVGSNQFPAHKCVLAGISDVFAAMFEINMKEKETCVVDITDLDADAVDKMLQFVYTGKIENIEQKCLCMLYTAADKYQILELKELCTFHIVKTISIESVCEIFVLAEKHQDQVLEQGAFNFAHANRIKLFDTENWRNFMEEELKLAATIMFQICKIP